MKEAENTASTTIIVHYLKRNDFAKAIELSEKMNFGYDEIVNAYLKEGNVSQAIKFAEKNDNDALDIVVDYLNDENKFNEAIELNIKLKDQWDRVWNMKETAEKSALAGQIEIAKKAIQQIIDADRYHECSYGDWTILYEIAILLEEKKLNPEHISSLLTKCKEHILSFSDEYDKDASIENFCDAVDESKMAEESKVRFKQLFK
jgi:tetratricopeptide (TPR) repeat protein